MPKEETVMVKVGILKLLLPGGYSILLPNLFFLKDDKPKSHGKTLAEISGGLSGPFAWENCSGTTMPVTPRAPMKFLLVQSLIFVTYFLALGLAHQLPSESERGKARASGWRRALGSADRA